jgi:Ca2+-binding RTX toxin-like protein
MASPIRDVPMKKPLLIALALRLAAPALGHGKQTTYNVLLAGGSEANVIHIWLTPDGRSYVIDSIVTLEVGGTVCANPEGDPYELVCQAPLVSSFEVNAGEGDDRVSIAKEISVPVTMRGGHGDDVLIGGGDRDRLVGGTGEDRLIGRGGDDWLFGGPGNDRLSGQRGNDICGGGLGSDLDGSCEVRKEIP